MKQTFYQLEGSKRAEFWTILHLPYTAMCLSFLTIGFGIAGIQRWDIYTWVVIAYFLGLGIAAHAFDQLPVMGSSYVKHWDESELLLLGVLAASGAVIIGLTVMGELKAMHLLWIIPLQTFFVWAYPNSKFMGGLFHNDFWFAISFGAIPVLAGYYINTLTFNIEFIPWAAVAALIAGIEITLSRYVRKWRKNVYLLSEPSVIERPERALQLLCVLSYTLAITLVYRGV